MACLLKYAAIFQKKKGYKKQRTRRAEYSNFSVGNARGK